MSLTFDELESELRKVEQAIATLNASDAFVEDLIARHAYRKALIAALSERFRQRPKMVATLASWHQDTAINDDAGATR